VTSFSAHFTLEEFARKSDRGPDAIEQQKAACLSQLLEIVRHALGDVPLVVTSWIRSDKPASAHYTGDAVDVRPRRDWSQRQIVDAVTDGLRRAGVQWGELIFYPFSDWHIHLTLYPVGGRDEILVADREEQAYAALTPAVLDTIPTTPAPFPPSQVGAIVVVALGAGVALAALGALST
jgi:hypothetical protein